MAAVAAMSLATAGGGDGGDGRNGNDQYSVGYGRPWSRAVDLNDGGGMTTQRGCGMARGTVRPDRPVHIFTKHVLEES